MNTGMRPIKSGAFGTVCSMHTEEHGEVAVKTIEITNGFRHPLELDVLFGFDHPNLIKGINLYPTESNGRKYMNIMMEKADCDMHVYTFNKGVLPYDQLVSVFHQCLSGLEALHKEDIIHLDIKPNNILIKREDKIKAWIIDYGMCRKIFPGIHPAKSGKIINNYIPPENSDNNRYDKYTDIWTLGLTFCFMASSKLLTSYEQWYSSKNSILSDILQRYTEQQRTLLLELLSRMLEHDKNKRASCTELLSMPIFRELEPINGGRTRKPITYEHLKVDEWDRNLFSKFWKFINRSDISPRTICNCIDIYHRYIGIIAESQEGSLDLHKTLSLCAAFIIAAMINDDIKFTPRDVLSGIFGPKVGNCFETCKLVYEYATIITVKCSYNISNAPLYNYISNSNSRDKYANFIQHLKDIYDPKEYDVKVSNSPTTIVGQQSCINMFFVIQSDRKTYESCIA